MRNVIESLHQHVPFCEVDGDKQYSSQGIAGDQLTVERGVNSLMEVANGFDAEERKEGLHFEVGDFHAMIKFLQVSLQYMLFKAMCPCKYSHVYTLSKYADATLTKSLEQWPVIGRVHLFTCKLYIC